MSTLTITSGDVILVAPELSDAVLDPTDWDRTIAWAGDEISSSIGVQARIDRCGTFLVAHMMTELRQRRQGLNASGGPGGPLSAVTVDKISKTFVASDAWKTTSITAAVLQTTSYGREYLRLIRIFLGGGTSVAGNFGPVSSGGSWPNS